MKPTVSHRRHLPWAIALVLVWQLLAGWGQLHRVLHLGVPALASVGVQTDAPALGHEDGTGLCQLLDQLSLDSGATAAHAPAGAHAQPLAPAWAHCAAPSRTHTLLFEARGPPLRS